MPVKRVYNGGEDTVACFAIVEDGEMVVSESTDRHSDSMANPRQRRKRHGQAKVKSSRRQQKNLKKMPRTLL